MEEEEVQRILRALEAHEKRSREHTDKIYGKLDDQGQAIARIDERTKNQDKRIDRIERKSTVTGGAAGGVLAGFFLALKHFFGSGS